ncbi:MAG: 5-guanidino-2-oxopentanoate decarboxylase [Intrasporangium sp.]|uniref:5-guanidino-2-oxopentanoate decarboxylase n=1 Tax=Intrasporangium sp. TaxID=1925024 RepID=UPI0026479157|nr:5-guanidino-2-oxopentanoate decarboxylase [Intrasporangium sp.]MDN5796581.1 5-guanidino-2-oxopentanoate decarboxylase [Intrasporangium sp.]
MSESMVDATATRSGEQRTARMTGGQAVVAALAAHGVDVAFGIPGTHNLEIYRHLGDHGIRHVSPRHEQGAGYAADGYARSCGRPGVAIVTSGPAVLNATAALGQAYSDSIPILVVSPGLPVRHPALGNGILHETKNQGAAVASVAAASIRATSVAEIPVAVAQAFAIMRSGRPRPVHLEIPLDVLAEEGEVTIATGATAAPVAAPAEAVAAAADLLAGAVRPVLLVGGGARWAAPQVRALAERLGAPVVTTTNGKGVLPEDHPLALGAGIHLASVAALVAEADVVVAIGTELAPSDLWNGPLPITCPVVRVDIDPVGVVTNLVPGVALVGDAARTLDDVLAALNPDRMPLSSQPADRSQPADGVDRDAAGTAAQWRSRKDGDAATEGAEWLEIVGALADALPRDAILAGDSAMVCYYGAIANLPAYQPSSFLYPVGFGTLGYGLPAAIGAKVAHPDRPVVALLGDGGVMFTVAELATAAGLGQPLPVVIVDNSGYGEIRNEMIDRDDPVRAVTFPAPDFAALGRALGCHGVTVTAASSLADAVREALAADTTTVIHVIHTDPASTIAEGARP